MTDVLRDWRTIDSGLAADLLAQEAEAYGRLGWDVTEAWEAIEPARLAGRLPGFVVSGPEGPRGWTCFLLHGDVLQVAMLLADAPDTTAALLDAILASPEAAGAPVQTVFARDAAPGLRDALRARGFEVAEYAYRSLQPRRLPMTGRDLRTWRPDDAGRLTALAARAYAPEPGRRVFAPGGTPAEWRDYLTSLIAGNACGRLRADLSFVASRRAGRLDGVILTTDLDRSTAHVAQVVVDPEAQGRGLGTGLLTRVVDEAARRRIGRLTLLVSEHSTRARRIYDRLGFTPCAAFVSAVRTVGSHEGATDDAGPRRGGSDPSHLDPRVA